MEEFQVYEEKLAKILEDKKVWFKQHIFDYDVNKGERISDIEKKIQVVKSICFITKFKDNEKQPILVILEVEKKVDTKKLKKLLDTKDVYLASPEEVLIYTSYKIGGVPPMGHSVKEVIIDKDCLKHDRLLGGGGSPRALIEFKTLDMIRLNNSKIRKVSK